MSSDMDDDALTAWAEEKESEMSLLFEGSELERVALPEGVTGFGAAEMLFLLTGGDETPSLTRSRELLGPAVEVLGDPSSDSHQWARSAGASALLARGLVRESEHDAVPTAEAAALGIVVRSAYRWTKVGVAGEDSFDLGAFLEAPGMTAFLQPRRLDSWFASFDQAGTPAAELVMRFIDQLTEAHPGAGCWVTTWSVDRDPEIVWIARDPDSPSWGIAEQAEDGDKKREVVERDGVVARLQQLLPVGRHR